jgi:hypothetical protein
MLLPFGSKTCLPSALWECKSYNNSASYFVWVWNLVLHTKEEHRLRVFESRVVRRILGPKRDKVTGE